MNASLEDRLRGLPPAWLRANCPCPACCDPVSGQRLTGITDLPPGTAIAGLAPVPPAGGCAECPDRVTVTFAPDGHEAVFAAFWLDRMLAPAADARTEDAKRLWRAADFPGGVAATSWDRYLGDEQIRAQCLEALLTDGFVLLADVPAEPGSVLDVAGSMSFVRETNYGRLFDVRVVAEPANLAYSALAISPHTDNPYRDPVPTVQLLHCLANAAQGGDSALVDGFLAARLLREADPAAFGVLAGTPVTFAYRDAGAELRATKPMIGLDARGRIREVRYNNRSIQPLPPGDAAAVGAFYDAYRAFGEILLRPELALTFRLSPGECVAFDNTRVLHARTAFTAAGHRHLQGCYADLDGVESSLAVGRRADKEPA